MENLDEKRGRWNDMLLKKRRKVKTWGVQGIGMMLAIALVSASLGGCRTDGSKVPSDEGADHVQESRSLQKHIAQIDNMPACPSNYKYLDYKKIAQNVDEVLYEFAKATTNVPYDRTTGSPIGYWDDTKINVDFRTFGFPSYIGSQVAGYPEGTEALTLLGSLIGSSLIGIDKSNQTFQGTDGQSYTYDFVKMSEAFFNTDSDVRFVMNNKKGKTGGSFWYLLYPQIQFLELYRLYPDETWMEAIILEGAQRWHEALPYFVNSKGEPDFVFKSFDFAANMPVYGSDWNEPPNGGLAMIFYNAYMLTGDEIYLNDCKYVLDYLQKFPKNPYYEILNDYAAYVAAILNAYHGTDYDIQKFVNYMFDGDTDFRRGTQVVNAKWGDYDAYGLMAYSYSQYTGDGYAFAMNTFHLAYALMPVVKYDPRFSDALGKWFLHMSNSSRLFYGNEVPKDHQSCPDGSPADASGAIAYEGVKSSHGGVSPYSMGDQLALNWGGITDFGIYGGGQVGILGSMIQKTDVEQILQVDLNKTDTFSKGEYPAYLYYNPYESEKTITVNYGGTYKLFNTVTGEVLSEKAAGDFALTVPAEASVVIMLLPWEEAITETNTGYEVNGKLMAVKRASVNITSPGDAKISVISESEMLKLSYDAPKGDSVKRMTIKAGDEQLYSGEPVQEYRIMANDLGKGLAQLVVEIETENGLTDMASRKIEKYGY